MWHTLTKLFLSFILFVSLHSRVLVAQQIDFDHYKTLQCSGTIPPDFITLSQDKYKQNRANDHDRSNDIRVNQKKDDFMLQNAFIIDQLLHSGKVLFGDTVTKYVDQVADRVLVNQSDLRSKLRFYVLKADEANAFSTEQGIIFVTLGLIAQLENEAQLAFVLSHEIAHYEKHHTLDEYLHRQRVYDDNYSYGSHDDELRAISSYSREKELEADELGFNRLLGSGYDCNEAIGVLFVLQFAELPFEDFEFNADFLETRYMQFPKDLFLDSLRPIDLERDMENDDYSTHPNISKRRSAIEGLLEHSKDDGVKKFTISEKSFYCVRKISRFECLRMMLMERDYEAAFYNAYVLRKEDSSSYYLRLTMGKALYGMAKYKNDPHGSSRSVYYGEKEGQQQQCYHLFNVLEGPQLTMVALRFLYDLNAAEPSPQADAMIGDLAFEAVYFDEITIDGMKHCLALYQELQAQPTKDSANVTPAPPAQVDTTASSSDQSGYVSKYDKLRKQKKQKEQQEVVNTNHAEASKYYMLAFADIIDQPALVNYFKTAQELSDQRKNAYTSNESRYTNMSSYEARKQKQQENTKNKKKGLSLGIDSLVVIDPFYVKADDRKGVKYVSSENEQLQLSNDVASIGNEAGLSVEMLNPKTFGPNDVDRYNDVAAINDWINEVDENDTSMHFLPTQSDRMIPIMKKYNTCHICYTGVYTYKSKRNGRGGILLLTALFYPLLPLGIAYALTPEHHTNYYTWVYNGTNGHEELRQVVTLKSKAKPGYINSVMYDLMIQMKRHPKK